jgi:hypothetical protein
MARKTKNFQSFYQLSSKLKHTYSAYTNNILYCQKKNYQRIFTLTEIKYIKNFKVLSCEIR